MQHRAAQQWYGLWCHVLPPQHIAYQLGTNNHGKGTGTTDNTLLGTDAQHCSNFSDIKTLLVSSALGSPLVGIAGTPVCLVP